MKLSQSVVIRKLLPVQIVSVQTSIFFFPGGKGTVQYCTYHSSLLSTVQNCTGLYTTCVKEFEVSRSIQKDTVVLQYCVATLVLYCGILS